jgi:hypothetical protein
MYKKNSEIHLRLLTTMTHEIWKHMFVRMCQIKVRGLLKSFVFAVDKSILKLIPKNIIL